MPTYCLFERRLHIILLLIIFPDGIILLSSGPPLFQRTAIIITIIFLCGATAENKPSVPRNNINDILIAYVGEI